MRTGRQPEITQPLAALAGYRTRHGGRPGRHRCDPRGRASGVNAVCSFIEARGIGTADPAQVVGGSGCAAPVIDRFGSSRLVGPSGGILRQRVRATDPITGRPRIVVESDTRIGMPSNVQGVRIGPCIRRPVAQCDGAVPRDSTGEAQ